MVAFEFFVQDEVDAASGGDGGDLGAVEEACGDDVEDLAGLGAEHAGEVGGLVAGQGGVGGVPGVGVKVSAIQRRRMGQSVGLMSGWDVLVSSGGRGRL